MTLTSQRCRRCGRPALAGPGHVPATDIAFCRGSGHGALFVGETDPGGLVATVMVGHDGRRGWVYYLAVEPGRRKRGYGRQMLRHAEHWLRVRGAPKLLLMIDEGNLAVQPFYERLGYERVPSITVRRPPKPAEP